VPIVTVAVSCTTRAGTMRAGRAQQKPARPKKWIWERAGSESSCGGSRSLYACHLGYRQTKNRSPVKNC